MLAMAAEVYAPMPGRVRSCGGGLGQLAAMLDDDGFCAFMQEAGAAVVAETAPGGEDFVFSGCGERFDGWELLHPVGVVIQDGGDAGLLQHDLGDPDGVGVAGTTPGEIAFVSVEPGEEIGAERIGFAQGTQWPGGKEIRFLTLEESAILVQSLAPDSLGSLGVQRQECSQFSSAATRLLPQVEWVSYSSRLADLRSNVVENHVVAT